MPLSRLFWVVLCLCLLQGCSWIASKTTGEGPIGTDDSDRSFGRMIDDQLIETYIMTNIRKADEGFKGAHIDITSYNGIVLLTGQVSSDQLSSLAESTARQVRNVRRVHNALTVAGPTSIPARLNDSWLKTKIKTRMLFTEGANPAKIKVVVEDGGIYLMGLVTQEQADQAVELAHRTYGVQKIVKVFEYLN